MSDLIISRSCTIPANEIEISAIRSQGAGGQAVNKISSAIHLRFDVKNSTLTESQKEKILTISDQRLSKEGVIIIKAQTSRRQEKNRTEALDRLKKLIADALKEPKKRRPTKPTRGSQEKRINHKVNRGKTKSLREKVDY